MSGPLPRSLAPLTIPASWLYGAAVSLRNQRYDRDRAIESLSVPVISVGNITTGGTGKTPMVMWIADVLRSAGRSPVIAMRGYGANAAEPSDEALLYADRLPDVPVVANPDRIRALRTFLDENPATDVVVLDDGFQHRGLARQLDLVLIDATQWRGRQRLLPAGHLREPLSNLSRADAVIVTRADAVDDRLAKEIALVHGAPPVAWSRHVWTGLDVYEDGVERNESVQWLQGRKVTTVLGVGNPEAVLGQTRQAGATIVANVPVRDHQRYTPGRVGTIRRACDAGDTLLVTAKDWVKLRGLLDLSTWPWPIVVPRLRLKIFEGQHKLRGLLLKRP